MMDVFDEPAVQQRLQYQDLIPAIAQALAALSAGKGVQPVRSVLPVAPHQGFFAVMPAYAGALGAKLVTFYPKNVGIHTHHAVIVLFKAETGEPLAVMDGRLITEMRTAAASAVATQRLARVDASVLAILGSGVQAKSHLAALRHVRSFKEVRVWSPRNAPAFAQRHGVKAAATAADPVRPIVLDEIRDARKRIAGTIIRTPLVRLELGPEFPDVRLKLENLQPINAYKLRGAANAVALLSEEERKRGVWTISAGNAGQGVAYAAREAGVPCTVVVVETAPKSKLDRMKALGAKVIPVSYDIAWKALDERSFPGAEGTFIHPFDDDNL